MTAQDSYQIDVVLSQMDPSTGEFRQSSRIVISAGEANDGSADVVFPPMGALNGGEGTYPVVLGVEVTSLPPPTGGSDGEEVSPTTPLLPVYASLLSGAVQRWSPVLYFSSGDSSSLRDGCERWRAEQAASATMRASVFSALPPCPRTLQQARAPNSGFREDSRGVATMLSRNFFHPGSDTCFRQTTAFTR